MREADQQGTPGTKTMERAPRPALSWLAVGGALLLFALLARTLTAYPLEPLRLTLGGADSTPTLTTIQQDSGVPGLQLQNVKMLSSTDGWATGYYTANDGTGSTDQLLLHWNGVTWSRMTSVGNNAGISALAALSGDYLWLAEGDAIYEYLGGAWNLIYQNTTDATNGNYSYITTITMQSPFEGWAAGIVSDSTGQVSFALRCHDGVWTREELPSLSEGSLGSAARDLSMSPDGNEGWLVGSSYTNVGDVGYALHYVNGVWTEADKDIPGGVTGVAMVGNGDAWAVGITGSGAGPGYIVHWHDGVWQHVVSPTTNQLHAITDFGGEEWVAGDGAATLHYHDGVWQRVGLVIHGTQLSGISMTDENEGWAVGGGLMLRDHHGVWSVYPLSL